MRPFRFIIVTLGFLALMGLGACSCGPKVDEPPGPAVEDAQPVIIEPTAEPTAVPTARVEAPKAPAPTTAPPPPTAVPRAVQPKEPPQPPKSGRWIDVDVARYTVRLMDGQAPMRTISPVAVGREIDTGAYESTATGLFHIYSKTAERTYDAPYKTYISNWVGFDPSLDNGFHSFLEDKDGKVVDASTGKVSNGCIRTGESAAIFAFAEIGMPVFVHT